VRAAGTLLGNYCGGVFRCCPPNVCTDQEYPGFYQCYPPPPPPSPPPCASCNPAALLSAAHLSWGPLRNSCSCCNWCSAHDPARCLAWQASRSQSRLACPSLSGWLIHIRMRLQARPQGLYVPFLGFPSTHAAAARAVVPKALVTTPFARKATTSRSPQSPLNAADTCTSQTA